MVAARLLNAPGDSVAVQGTERDERPQDHQVQSALKKVKLVFHYVRSCGNTTSDYYFSCGMATYFSRRDFRKRLPGGRGLFQALGHCRGIAARFSIICYRHPVESAQAFALPSSDSQCPDMNFDWLVQQARMNNIRNRLGFCVTLARAASGNDTLLSPEQKLRESKLSREDYFGSEPNEVDRRWLQEHSSDQARQWSVLSDLRPGSLRYVA